MIARKPTDPRDDIPLSEVLHDSAAGTLPVGSEEARAVLDEVADSNVGRHANVEVESGPTERERRDDPLPEAP